MQHQQPQVGGGGGYGGGAAAEMLISDEDQKLGDLGIAEAASPISSRPPASTTIGNNTFEEMIQATAEAGGSSGNRWPRQETLALLQIRSEMDAAFRDATLKGPLWEQVSRKLGDLGYKRSGKKCKEKFENVHKYYKRTKEGRGGRQDGKSYKFFTQLEALHHNTATAVQVPPRTTAVATVPLSLPPPPFPPPVSVSLPPPPYDHISTGPSNIFGNVGVNFSSDSSSSSDGEDEDEDEEMEMEMESTGDATNRKRKRSGGGGEHSDERMMDFFEGLLKQVMQKQEAMQQKFLEAIEKREQDRMIREEAWKRQDMARIAREHDLMAQERAISASRDAAIVAFLEKITGQTIHLPTATPQNPPPPPPTAATEPPHPPPPPSERQTHPHQGNEAMEPQIKNTCSDMVAVMPEQQQIVPHQDSTVEMNSSRWPKTEVLALIQLRSGKETKYQESGPKGPLWEEISADMQRMGYNRNPKRCKEKWENINKYFKKVKESNKKRPEDAKTCPYFNELDAWYRKKQHGVAASSNIKQAEDDVGMQTLAPNVASVDKAVAFSSTPFDQHRVEPHDIGGEKQPEDMLKKQHQRSHGDHLIDNCNNNVDHSNSDDLGHENEDEDNYEEVDENDEEMKMVYKIQFPRQNVRPTSNGGGTTSSSFVAMVQ